MTRQPSRISTYGINTSVVLISLAVGMLLAEGLVRLIYKPINFFKATLQQDSILRHRIAPHSAGHDEWGYRNDEVPDSSTIVAIGDSQTYGASAFDDESWPEQLEQLTGDDVYNLALGGYGPVQYAHMLETQALRLKPRQIIAGFYLGNDLYDAYYLAYKVPHWKALQDSAAARLITDTTGLYDIAFETKRAPFSIKGWLADHSIVYNVIFVRSFIGDIIRGKRNEQKVKSDSTYTQVDDKAQGINATFIPSMRLYALDLEDLKIREGLRVSLNRFHHMDSICKVNNIEFSVVIIPTKESVYSTWLANNAQLKNHDVIDDLLKNEQMVVDQIRQDFTTHHIKFLEVRDSLAAHVRDNIYPNDSDGHPNGQGYRIVAKAIR
jgi:lysophospholipase L1-like esterase